MQKSMLKAVGITILLALLTVAAIDLAYVDDGMSRTLLKVGGLVKAVLGILGVAVTGYWAGKDYDSHTGWERTHYGAWMFYNRKPFRRDGPTYSVEGPTRRIHWEESFIGRMKTIIEYIDPPDGSAPKWTPDMGVDGLPEPFRGFFEKHPDRCDAMLENMGQVLQQMVDWEKYKTRFAIADAWSSAMASSFADPFGKILPVRAYPPEPAGTPEDWDFRGIRVEGPLPFKSPRHVKENQRQVTTSWVSVSR
jgi:hypothetical protein